MPETAALRAAMKRKCEMKLYVGRVWLTVCVCVCVCVCVSVSIV